MLGAGSSDSKFSITGLMDSTNSDSSGTVTTGNPLFDKANKSAKEFIDNVRNNISEASPELAEDQQELKDEFGAGPLTDQTGDSGDSGGIPTFNTGEALNMGLPEFNPKSMIDNAQETAETAGQTALQNSLLSGLFPTVSNSVAGNLPGLGSMVSSGTDGQSGDGGFGNFMPNIIPGTGSSGMGFMKKAFIGLAILVFGPILLKEVTSGK